MRNILDAPILPFLPQVTLRSLGNFATRQPGASGSLDPGSLYGYIQSQPNTQEGQSNIGQDLALQMMGGVQPIKKFPLQQGIQNFVEPLIQAAKNPFEKIMKGYTKKLVATGEAENILGRMAAENITPQQVANEFWSRTFHKMSESGKQHAIKYLEDHTGMKLGWKGTTLQDMINSIDLGNDVEVLQGTENGFTALMKYANDKVKTLPQLSLPALPQSTGGEIRKLEAQLHPNDVKTLQTDKAIEGWSDKQYKGILQDKIQELKDFQSGAWKQGATLEELRGAISDLRRTEKEMGKTGLTDFVLKGIAGKSDAEALRIIKQGQRQIRDGNFAGLGGLDSTLLP